MPTHHPARRLPALAVVVLALGALAYPGACAAASETEGAYRVQKHDFPAALRPGQTFVGHVTVDVLAPGEPAYTRPFAELRALGGSDRIVRLPGEKMTPWKLPVAQKAGDTLHVAFTLEVPLDFPAGPADLAFFITRNLPDRGWQHAAMDPGDGGPRANAFRRPLKVEPRDGAAAALPLVAGRLADPPKLDGRVEHAEWQGAAAVPGFQENAGGGAPKAATRAYVGYDDRALHLAFVCQEPRMAQAVARTFTARDPSLWSNECVEVFLNPQADRVSYVHFIADMLGQRYDALGSDAFGYNPQWECAAARAGDSWSVEIAIPFASLAVPAPQPGDAWYANLCRERKAEPELSAWQPTSGTFAAPGRFGLWVFGSLKAYLERQAAPLLAPPPAPPTVGGVGGAEPEAAGAWRKDLQAWGTQLAGLEEASAGARYTELAGELKRLQEQQALLRLKAARLSGQSYLVTQGWPYERFEGKTTDLDRLPAPIQVAILQGEWVDLALNLTNLTDAPITLRCSLRRGKPDDPAGFLRLGMPGLTAAWQQALPVAAGDGRPVHDALAPIPAGTVQVPAGTTSQVWLSLRAPEGATAGGEGSIVVQPVDGTRGEPVVLPLSVRVVPVALAANPPVHVFQWNILPTDVAAEQPAWFAAHLRDLREHGVDVCMISGLRHLPRVKARPDGTLAEPLDFPRLDALLDATRDLFPLYYLSVDIWEKSAVRRDLFGLPFDSPGYEKAFKTWLTAIVEHIGARGVSRDRLLVNPYDESVNESCQTIARWVKAVDPKLRVIVDCSTPDLAVARQMDALTDIWVPHYKYHFAEELGPFFGMVKGSGKAHWCYFYSEGGTDKAQDPTRHYLAKFWWAYAQGITGVCYWAQQYYGDPWYRAQYRQAYDTSLVYPTEEGPIPSRRWQAWRRGWQDTCLLALAREALKRAGDAAGLAELDRRIQEVVTVPGDPRKAEETRAWLRETIAR